MMRKSTFRSLILCAALLCGSMSVWGVDFGVNFAASSSAPAFTHTNTIDGVTFMFSNESMKAETSWWKGQYKLTKEKTTNLTWSSVPAGYSIHIDGFSVTAASGGNHTWHAYTDLDAKSDSYSKKGTSDQTLTLPDSYFNNKNVQCIYVQASSSSELYIKSFSISYTLIPNEYTLTFDATTNGGTCATPSKNVTFKSTYGTLPTASKDGFVFDGWFTAAVGGEKVLPDNVVSTAADHTVYAQFKQGNVDADISKTTNSLDWYTTYEVASLFTSTNPDSPIVIKLNGNVITELTTTNENSITVSVSQAAAGHFNAVEDLNVTFAVAPAAEYAPLYLFYKNEPSAEFETSKTIDYTFQNDNLECGTLSFEYKTSSAATRQLTVYEQVAGTWSQLGTYSANSAFVGVSAIELNPAATGVRFQYAGTGWGSAIVQKVKVTRASYVRSDGEVKFSTLNASGSDVVGTFPLYYGNVHTVLYDANVVGVQATNGATATLTIAQKETIENGEADYGAYHFDVMLTCDQPVSVVTGNAHFYTSDGKDLIIPITIECQAALNQGFAMFYNEDEVELSGADAYTASWQTTDGVYTLKLDRVDGNVPAETACLLYKENASGYCFEMKDNPTLSAIDNAFYHTITSESAPEGVNFYVLGAADGEVAFYKYTGIVPADKVVLRWEQNGAEAPARFAIRMEEEEHVATALVPIYEKETLQAGSEQIYTIMGVPVSSMSAPGIYIQNGKKMIVR